MARSYAVLIVSPKGYIHSECFTEVAETISDGLEQLGYESRVAREIVPGHRHIVLGSHLISDYYSHLPSDSILYNLEQIEGNEFLAPSYLNMMRRYNVWDYSSQNVTELARQGIEVQAVLPIGYSAGLSRIPKSGIKDIDVLFIGSLSDRRNLILDEIERTGLKTVRLFGKYGADRDSYIARSRLLLNLHLYPAGILERVRISYFLANQIAVLSEESSDQREDADWTQGVCLAPYHSLVSEAVRLCSDEASLEDLARKGFDFIKTRGIAHDLAQALTAPVRSNFIFDTARRSGMCPCGSGKRFKHCHGSFSEA